MTFKTELTSDQSFIRYKRIVKDATNVDTAAHIKEIQSLHAGRLTASLSSKKLSAKRIIKASMLDQSYRSRIVSIIVTATFVLNNLVLVQSSMESYIISTYGKHLTGRTKSERYASAGRAISQGAKAIAELESLIEIGDKILDDIDKAAWSLKLAVTALEVATKREVNI